MRILRLWFTMPRPPKVALRVQLRPDGGIAVVYPNGRMAGAGAMATTPTGYGPIAEA